MIYELVNPSDAITIEADDELAACIGIVIFGEGYLTLKNDRGESLMPVFAFGPDFDKWLESKGVKDSSLYFDANAGKIAGILESAVYGNIPDRRAFDSMTQRMSPEAAVHYREGWNNKRRTSLRNIVARMAEFAAKLRAMEESPVQA